MSTGCRAALEAVAVFDLSQRSHLRIAGSDRAKFLHNFCTNDIQSLTSGHGCEACFCNAKGRVLGHATIFATESELWLESVPTGASTLLSHLDRYLIREDVELRDETAGIAEIAVVGPDAVRWLQQSLQSQQPPLDCDLAELTGDRSPRIWTPTEAGDLLAVLSVDWLTVPVILLLVFRPKFAEWWSQLHELGAYQATAEDWEMLRIDAGWPTYGVDFSDDHLPQEIARNDRCLNFRKGCYLGQEPIARLDALGHTNRELRRLALATDTLPTPGAVLCDRLTRESVGSITSATHAPNGSGCVALGYVKTKWNAPGTEVLLADTSDVVMVRSSTMES